MNFQPVLPVKINDKSNMIIWVVLPIVTQYNITAPGEKQSGLGDAVMSAFFSPANSEKLTWGWRAVVISLFPKS
jgi:hypothetical protein